jgi:hypothetical protein
MWELETWICLGKDRSHCLVKRFEVICTKFTPQYEKRIKVRDHADRPTDPREQWITARRERRNLLAKVVVRVPGHLFEKLAVAIGVLMPSPNEQDAPHGLRRGRFTPRGSVELTLVC